jgi:hypothetical protein
MSETAQPRLVVDADRDTSTRVDTPEYQAFLAWLRSEGIVPEQAKRCEVYDARDGKPPYAIVHVFEVDEKGVKVYDEITDEAVTHTEIVTLSSLPPLGEGVTWTSAKPDGTVA